MILPLIWIRIYPCIFHCICQLIYFVIWMKEPLFLKRKSNKCQATHAEKRSTSYRSFFAFLWKWIRSRWLSKQKTVLKSERLRKFYGFSGVYLLVPLFSKHSTSKIFGPAEQFCLDILGVVLLFLKGLARRRRRFFGDFDSFFNTENSLA